MLDDSLPKCYCGQQMVLERTDVERGGFGSVLLRVKDFPYYRCPDDGSAQMNLEAVLEFDLKYHGILRIYDDKREEKWFRKKFIREHLRDLEYYRSHGLDPFCECDIPFTKNCYASGNED